MTNEVTIDLNMFSTFMKDIIMSNLNSTSIITVKFSCSGTATPRSCSNQRNQISSAVVAASALYSASVLERATTVCFLLLQEIRESPRRKQYPVVDRRSVGSPAQSASEYA